MNFKKLFEVFAEIFLITSTLFLGIGAALAIGVGILVAFYLLLTGLSFIATPIIIIALIATIITISSNDRIRNEITKKDFYK